MPKVSVIMPVYKGEKYLGECLDSILGQTLKDIEIICVDDGSPDNCGKILDEYAAKDSRMKVIHQENKGIFLARKAGVLASTGDYIMYSDDDDKYVPDACEKAYNAIREKNVDILKFGMTAFSDNGILSDEVKAENQRWLKSYGHLTTKRQQFETLYTGTVLLWDKIFKGDVVRKAYREIADCRILFGEDPYALLHIIWFSESMDSIPDQLYLHRYGCGITTNGDQVFAVQQLSKDLQVIPLLFKFVDKKAMEGNDVTELKRAMDTRANRLFDYFFQKFDLLHDKAIEEQALENCLNLLPGFAVKMICEHLKKQKMMLDVSKDNLQKAYDELDILRERYNQQNNTKAVRLARLIKRLLGKNK